MNSSSILAAIFIALCFVGWPIVGKYTEATGAWIGGFGMAVTAFVAVAIYWRGLVYEIPPAKAIFALVAVSILNGVAVCLYAEKVADRSVPTAIFVVAVSVLMVAAAPLLDWMFNGAIPNVRQVIGLVLAGAAVYFLGR